MRRARGYMPLVLASRSSSFDVPGEPPPRAAEAGGEHELVSVWDLRIDDEAWLDHRWERVVAFEWIHGSVALTTDLDGWRRRRVLAADEAVQRRAPWR